MPIFEFSRKGYPTESSGFYGDYGEKQAVDGLFELDTESIKKIKALGAKVINVPNVRGFNKCRIEFYPINTDLVAMTRKWGKIAAILPQKGTPQLSTSGASEYFRKKYAPERTDIELKALEKLLVISEFEPNTEKEIKDRIEELTNILKDKS